MSKNDKHSSLKCLEVTETLTCRVLTIINTVVSSGDNQNSSQVCKSDKEYKLTIDYR